MPLVEYEYGFKTEWLLAGVNDSNLGLVVLAAKPPVGVMKYSEDNASSDFFSYPSYVLSAKNYTLSFNGIHKLTQVNGESYEEIILKMQGLPWES